MDEIKKNGLNVQTDVTYKNDMFSFNLYEMKKNPGRIDFYSYSSNYPDPSPEGWN